MHGAARITITLSLLGSCLREVLPAPKPGLPQVHCSLFRSTLPPTSSVDVPLARRSRFPLFFFLAHRIIARILCPSPPPSHSVSHSVQLLPAVSRLPFPRSLSVKVCSSNLLTYSSLRMFQLLVPWCPYRRSCIIIVSDERSNVRTPSSKQCSHPLPIRRDWPT